MASSSNLTRVNSVLIGSGQNSQAIAGLTLSTMKKGDLALVLDDNTIIKTVTEAGNIASNRNVYLVAGTGDGIKKSSPLKPTVVTAVNHEKYRAKAVQVSYLGYDGTTIFGLPADNEQEYVVTVLINSSSRIYDRRQNREDYSVPTDGTASQEKLALSALKLFYNKKGNGSVKKFNGRFVDMFVICDAAAGTGATAAGTFTKNSKYVSFAGAHGITAGSFIRVGTLGTNLDPVYKVKSVTANALTLETPFIGNSVTYLAAEVTTITSTPATNYAFKYQGQEPPINDHDEYEVVRFETYFNRADNTSTFTDVAEYVAIRTDYGAGYWKAVWDSEFHAGGYEGVLHRTAEIDVNIINPKALTEVGKEYHAIIIEGTRKEQGSLQTEHANPIADEVYIPVVTTVPIAGEQAFAGGTDDFVAIFNAYFSTKLGYEAVDFS